MAELGMVGAIRFMQQFETGHGDYSREGHKHITKKSAQELLDKIYRHRKNPRR